MKAKKKKLDKLTPEDLGVELKPHLTVTSVSEPPKRQARPMLAGRRARFASHCFRRNVGPRGTALT